LTFTCYRRYRFLSSPRTCTWLAQAIEEARSALDFALWAYVFMPEHVHMILWPLRRDYAISEILKAIKRPVGQLAIAYLREHASEWLPRIERRRGHRVEHLFWQSGGGFDRNIVEPSTMLAMIEYLHQNPVRRGLVQRASDWTWSSAGWYAEQVPNGLRPDPIPPEWVTTS
jgi:putative transposase